VIHSISPAEAQELVTRGDIDVIDVREPHEWSTGHIPGARLVPLAQLRANPKAAITRDAVLFVCAAGTRSQTAARLAASIGIEKIYDVRGGVRGWVKAGLALEPSLDVAV
jgi:adenylyltransferase/sulfurtransferase